METSAVVRVARGEDIETLERLRRAATEEEVGPVVDPDFAEQFRGWFQREADRRVFWIATVDATPVGTANLVVFRRMPRPGRDTGGWGYLGNAYVMTSHRNQGIGRQLLATIVDYADTEGLEGIVLKRCRVRRGCRWSRPPGDGYRRPGVAHAGRCSKCVRKTIWIHRRDSTAPNRRLSSVRDRG